VLLDLVPASNAEIDLAFANEGGDIGGGQEDEGDGVVLNEGDVEAVLAAELDVRALKQVQCSGIQTALCKEKN
jgi:hypothetical protein